LEAIDDQGGGKPSINRGGGKDRRKEERGAELNTIFLVEAYLLGRKSLEPKRI